MSLLIVHVYVHVKPEYVEEFKAATLENARESIKEPGVVRFDVIQQQDDPARFVLLEVYKTPEAPAQHKETEHYAKWQNTVEGMLAEPRSRIKYTNVFPEDEGWS